ncbi:MAG: flagellar hook-length control protein FliK [Burkholderiaceae bacterium]
MPPPAPTRPGRADAGRSDRLSALGQAAAGPDATAASAGAVDIAGFQRVLDATPVNLATADAASASTAAAADFSLPSLGAGGGAAAAAAPEAPPAQATLAPPPGSPAFPAALGAQLNTWLKDGVQYATLELNPQDMGPIDVRIALHGGRTQVELGADVAETRAALADALPALADALGDVGLSLSGGSVSDQTGQHAREGEAQGQRAFAMPGWLAPARDGAEGAGAAARPAAQRGLVDLVA